jgi:hypothetical protein
MLLVMTGRKCECECVVRSWFDYTAYAYRGCEIRFPAGKINRDKLDWEGGEHK